MEKTGWKTLAIIFITLFVLVTLFLVWAFLVGTDMIDKEYECAYNICSETDSYIYYDYEEICECYTNNELIKQIYLG